MTSAAASSTKWWISTTDRTLRYTPRDCVSCTSCVCGASLHELGPCRCQSIQAKWILDDDFRLKQGADCAFLNIDKLDISACPAGLDSRLGFVCHTGVCHLGTPCCRYLYSVTSAEDVSPVALLLCSQRMLLPGTCGISPGETASSATTWWTHHERHGRSPRFPTVARP